MLTILDPYTEAIRVVKEQLNEIVEKIIIDNKTDIINILKEDQLGKGLNSKGNVVGLYSAATPLFIAAQNRTPRKPKVAGQPYNFEDHGDFFDGMDLNIKSKGYYNLFSSDKKEKILKDEHGDITSLTKQNNNRVNEVILIPLMIEEVINRLSSEIDKSTSL